MADLAYDPATDTVKSTETLPSDAIDQQVALWQASIDKKTQEIKDLQAAIDSLQPQVLIRASALQAKAAQVVS